MVCLLFSVPNNIMKLRRLWIGMFLLWGTLVNGQGVYVHGVDPICQGESVSLVAIVTGISYGTQSYSFEVLPDYLPEAWYPDATPVPSGDDQNHGPFDVGFDFCFFNTLYSQFYIGSNGWVGFSSGQSNSFVAQEIPSTNASVPKNCIMAPWQDWHPGIGVGNKIFYKTIGSAPERKLIVYWRNCPMYGCATQLGTFQIVLCESGSEVYNHIEQKPVCNNSYSQNFATQGVHDATGTIAFTAIDHNTLVNRNRTSWYVDEDETPPTYPESTRFVPNGIVWHTGSETGPVVGYGATLAVSPIITTTYFAVASSCIGESYFGSTTVVVNPHPTLSGPDHMCPGATGSYSTETGMLNYVWSATGGAITSGGTSTSHSAEVTWNLTGGDHKVAVTYTDPVSGCAGTVPVEFEVEMYPLPVVTTDPLAPVCVTAAPFPLAGGNPSGGIWSGTAVSGGIFSPLVAGVGVHTLTYTYTDGLGCINSADATIEVWPLPVVTFPSLPDVCVDYLPFALAGATPEGGTYTGPGVAAGQFDPSVAGTGTHNLTYTYTDANGCSNFTEQTITVNPLPVVTQQPFSPICVDGAAVLLSGGSPTGGSYSGTGVSGGLFTPSFAGPGNHPITYTFSDANGCVNNATEGFLVNPLPDVTLSDPAGVCITTPPFSLTGGSPQGGVYSGEYVSNGTFNPPVAGIGSHPITYTYTDANGCTNLITKNIQVVGPPSVDFSGPTAPSTVCQDYPSPSRYEVAPTSSTTYTWTIPPPFTGILNPVAGFPNMVDITWTGTGTAQLKLEASSLEGCYDTKTKEILVNPKPSVSLSACFDLVTTTNAKPFLLKGGTPLGDNGKFYVDGNLLVSTTLDPSTLAGGDHTITYTYTDINGCLASAEQTLTVGPSNAGYQCFNGIFTDPRNPNSATNKYRTLSVTANGRTTCWMVTNLHWGTTISEAQPQTDNCLVERYCQPSDPSCDLYGSYFQWDELMQYQSTPGWNKGVCPPGWHVASAQDWQDLIDANQGNGQASGNLREYINDHSFHALLIGILYLNSTWAFTPSDNPAAGMFWTSDLSGNKAIARGLNNINPSISIYESSKANAFPVRCVKDN